MEEDSGVSPADWGSPPSIVFSGNGVTEAGGETSETSVWVDETVDEDTEPSVGALAGDDFRSRQTKRTFLNTTWLVFKTELTYFYR